MKIVIDTNDFISALITQKHRMKLLSIMEKPEIEIFANENLIQEIKNVASREKFRKYVTLDEISLFVDVVTTSFTLITTTTQVSDSPDPKDNFLLALAIDSQAKYLITGDKKDLLALSPYRGIKIVRLQEFLDVIHS